MFFLSFIICHVWFIIIIIDLYILTLSRDNSVYLDRFDSKQFITTNHKQCHGTYLPFFNLNL